MKSACKSKHLFLLYTKVVKDFLVFPSCCCGWQTQGFPATLKGMQKLLNVVQEFTARCGIQINVKNTYLVVIDNDKKRREQEPATLLTINGETLQAMNLDDACKYLGY